MNDFPFAPEQAAPASSGCGCAEGGCGNGACHKKARLDGVLYGTAVRAFEDIAFMFPFPPESTDTPAMQAATSVAYRGPFQGRLVLEVCDALLPAIATNMLGMDEDPTDEQQRDALGEMANIVCGNVLPAIAGNRAVFRLQPPQDVPITAPDGPAPACVVRVPLDQGNARVTLFMDGGWPQGEPA